MADAHWNGGTLCVGQQHGHAEGRACREFWGWSDRCFSHFICFCLFLVIMPFLLSGTMPRGVTGAEPSSRCKASCSKKKFTDYNISKIFKCTWSTFSCQHCESKLLSCQQYMRHSCHCFGLSINEDY